MENQNNTEQIPSSSSSQNSDSKNLKKKWILIASSIFVVLLIFAVIVFFIFQNNSSKTNQDSKKSNSTSQNQISDLPENTCPSELKNIDGKQKAVYQGQILNISLENYNWIQQNCNLNNSNNSQNSPTPTQKNTNNSKPVLTNLGIKFGKYNPTTKKAGDFVFDKSNISLNSGDSNKIFFEFGADLQTKEGKKTFPEIIYNQVAINTEITAIADGKVLKIEFQDNGISKDYSLEILFGNTNWVTIYDHIINLKVKEGDIVNAGMILGNVSANRDNKTGFTEIQVKYGNSDGTSTAYCPLDLLTSEAKAQYSTEITQLMKDWESFYGNTNLYNESAQITPGCAKSSFTE